jgi:hypothetical protein
VSKSLADRTSTFDLLHEAKGIPDAFLLNQFAASEAKKAVVSDLHEIARCRGLAERSFVRAGRNQLCGCRIAFGDNLLNLELHIGKCRGVGAIKLLAALDPVHLAIWRMNDAIVAIQLSISEGFLAFQIS